MIYLDLLGFGTTCFEEAELGGLSEEREVRYADHPMKGEKKIPNFGWVRMALGGLSWIRNISDDCAASEAFQLLSGVGIPWGCFTRDTRDKAHKHWVFCMVYP